MAGAIDRLAIERVYTLIQRHIRKTPTVDVAGADFGLAQRRVVVKLELLQRAGSFKTRGAFTNLLTRAVPPAGVVAASGGNHGAAVAYAAMQLKVPAKIFVPTISSPAKIDRIRRYGADLVVGGERYADALAASEAYAAETGALAVHAFDQRETLLGQGTLALELDGQAPDLDTVLVAVGGGGLIGGIAAWYRGRVRVIGVEPALAPRRVGELMFPLARDYIERVVLVEDTAIERAQRALWDALRIVAEPGGAAALSALLSGAYQPAPDERVGIVVSGGNSTAVRFA